MYYFSVGRRRPVRPRSLLKRSINTTRQKRFAPWLLIPALFDTSLNLAATELRETAIEIQKRLKQNSYRYLQERAKNRTRDEILSQYAKELNLMKSNATRQKRFAPWLLIPALFDTSLDLAAADLRQTAIDIQNHLIRNNYRNSQERAKNRTRDAILSQYAKELNLMKFNTTGNSGDVGFSPVAPLAVENGTNSSVHLLTKRSSGELNITLPPHCELRYSKIFCAVKATESATT